MFERAVRSSGVGSRAPGISRAHAQGQLRAPVIVVSALVAAVWTWPEAHAQTTRSMDPSGPPAVSWLDSLANQWSRPDNTVHCERRMDWWDSDSTRVCLSTGGADSLETKFDRAGVLQIATLSRTVATLAALRRFADSLGTSLAATGFDESDCGSSSERGGSIGMVRFSSDRGGIILITAIDRLRITVIAFRDVAAMDAIPGQCTVRVKT